MRKVSANWGGFLGLTPLFWALSVMLAACGGGGNSPASSPPATSMDGVYYTAGINANSGGISSSIVKATFVAGSNTASYEQILSDTTTANQSRTGTLAYSVDSNGLVTTTDGGEITDGRLSGDGRTVVSARINSTAVHNISIGVKGATSGLSNASLKGVYYMTSFNVLSPGGVSSANTTITFDGVGNAVYSQTYSNETLVDQARNSSCTYNVTADGHITFTEGSDVTDGRLSADGNTFVATIINSTSSHNLSFGMKVGGSGFTNASLSGVYYAAGFGAYGSGYESRLFKFTFDGGGNVTLDAIYSDNTTAGWTSTGATTTYSVSTDGSFTIDNGSAVTGRLSHDAKSFVFALPGSTTSHRIYVGTKRQ